MSIPRRNRGWLREVELALNKALDILESGGAPLDSLHKHAPSFAAKARRIRDPDMVQEMRALCDSMYAEDVAIDPDRPRAPLFYFASGYIFSHVAAGLITEMEADRIMSYVNDNIDLFEE